MTETVDVETQAALKFLEASWRLLAAVPRLLEAALSCQRISFLGSERLDYKGFGLCVH